MKTHTALASACILLLSSLAAAAPGTGSPFYGDAPDSTHPWAIHDWNRPQPEKVEPKPYDAEKAKAPADAVVLFDGTEATLANWESDKNEGGATKWTVKDGSLVCVPKSGYVRSKAKFGDCQLHVEWAAPTPVSGDSQGRGNSGIFLEGVVEIQVLDNYDNPTYADGFACSMYCVAPPLANALRPPGEFQAIDITFRRPIYDGAKLVHPGYVTVYCNGVLVQNKTQIEGPTGHKGRTKAGPLPETGPLKLQDHGNPVKFRNIWYKPLPARTAADDEGIVGPLSEEATTAKRKEIAAMVRASAEKMADKPVDQMLRLAESLIYENEAATAAKVEKLTGDYVAELAKLPADKIGAKKDEAKRVAEALHYLAKFKVVADTYAPKVELDKLIAAQNWEGKKKK